MATIELIFLLLRKCANVSGHMVHLISSRQ
jgi:hypothetical protein